MKRLNREQSAIIGLYTGITCGPFEAVHEYAEKLMGHPVFTHQFADRGFVDKLREKSREDFISICYEGDKQ